MAYMINGNYAPTPFVDKCVCVIDNGLFIELAIKLSKSFGRTLYYTSWKDSYPSSNKAMIGTGIPKIERIDDLFDYIDEVDLFCFFDVYDGDLQEHLVKLGKNVWGSRKGENMELYRTWMKDYMILNKIPCNDYHRIRGIDNLRLWLKDHPDVYVKCEKFRGDFETFHSKNYYEICPRLDEIENNLGPLAHIKEFIVETPVEGVESGYDGYCIDGEFPTLGIVGIEVKDLGYVGQIRPYSQLPFEITGFNGKIKELLKNFNYRGFYSTEIRITEKGVPYMIDMCARAGRPPSELYQEMYSNLDEIMWYGAQGILVDPKPIKEFGVEVLIKSQWANCHWQPVSFDPQYRDNIKLANFCIIEDEYYVIPQHYELAEFGAIVAIGDSIDECLQKIEEIADSISGIGIEIPLGSLDKAMDEINKLKEQGIDVIDDD